jgi:hypothetical protein
MAGYMSLLHVWLLIYAPIVDFYKGKKENPGGKKESWGVG